MSEDIFRKFLNWIPKYSGVTLSGMGEPLINRNIVDYVQALRSKKAFVLLKTNGLFLTPDIIDKFIKADISHIQISVLGYNKDSVEKTMKGISYEKLLNTLEYILTLSNAPVSLYMLLDNENIVGKTKDDIFEKFKQLKSSLHSRGGFLYNNKIIKRSADLFSCETFSRMNFITWNGDILACCHDLTGNTKLGHIDEIDYQQLRRIKERKVSEGKWYPFCKYCDDELKLSTKVEMIL
jgi:MoaA/NifB/PqqE/SkfB family radical SAM enzyme